MSMQTVRVGSDGATHSRLIYGCMRLIGDGSAEGRARGKAAISTALDAGYTAFDHADIYAGGACERLFGEVLAGAPRLRDELFLVGKCGVRFSGDPASRSPKRYDLSERHIVASVEGSLRRLGTDRLDLLLLHRPDYLMDADEVAAAFDALAAAGKVRYFGVSNFSPADIDLLAAQVTLVANQVEINLHRVAALTDGTLSSCRRRGMTPQAWSPLAGSITEAWGNTFTADDRARIDRELDRQAAAYGVERWLVPLAWLLRHPSGIAPIIGSTTPARIATAVRAFDIEYSREDWYRLFEARNGREVP